MCHAHVAGLRPRRLIHDDPQDVFGLDRRIPLGIADIGTGTKGEDIHPPLLDHAGSVRTESVAHYIDLVVAVKEGNTAFAKSATRYGEAGHGQ